MSVKVLKAYEKERASLYGTPVYIILGTWEEYMDWRFQTYSVPTEPRQPYSAMHEMVYLKADGTAHSLIWMPKYEHTIEDMGTLAHECIHSAMRILEKVGIKVNTNEHEALTYLYNHIYISCLDILTDVVFGKKKRKKK